MTDNCDYKSYINSKAWEEKARRIRRRDGYRCQICGADDLPLEVHHLTYDNLGYEDDDDLITVCHSCHEKITESWNSVRDGVYRRNAYLSKNARRWNSFKRAEDVSFHLNTLMPYDISFGGKYVLSGHKDVKAACKEAEIEYRYEMVIQHTFNRIHIIDVVTQINGGVSRHALIEAGYPTSLIRDIAKRQKMNDNLVSEISDELVCFMHEGQGEWTVTAPKNNGSGKYFEVRFIPYKRYRNMWWSHE